jgi:STE24 endopeptidase
MHTLHSNRLPGLRRRPRHAVIVVAAITLVLAAAGAGPGAGAGAQQRLQPDPLVIDTTVPPAARKVPGVPLDPHAATNAYLAMVPPEQRARTDAYFEGRYWMQLAEGLLAIALMAALLYTGFSRRLRDRVERATGHRPVQTAAYHAIFYVVVGLVFLPLTIYAGFVRERQFGLMNLTFGQWFADFGKASLISLILATVAVVGLYSIFRRAPRSWPLWGSLAAVVFLGFTALIYPVYIAPVFNTYTPLADERVLEPVLRMARANGVDVDQVFVIDESRQSRRISAHVTGLLHTRRVALNDNLLNRTSLPEIKAVMGHEIGHYVLNHSYEMFVTMLVLLVTAFFILQRGFNWAVQRQGARWGIRGIDDVAGLPLLVLVFTVISVLGTPVTRTVTRVNEAEADAFGLNAAREPDGFARVALRLGEYRKLDPSPLEEALFYTHPSGRTRIYRAMVWKAAQESVPPTGAANPPGNGR